MADALKPTQLTIIFDITNSNIRQKKTYFGLIQMLSLYIDSLHNNFENSIVVWLSSFTLFIIKSRQTVIPYVLLIHMWPDNESIPA